MNHLETDQRNNFCCERSTKFRFVSRICIRFVGVVISITRFGNEISDGAFGLVVAASDFPKIRTVSLHMQVR